MMTYSPNASDAYLRFLTGGVEVVDAWQIKSTVTKAKFLQRTIQPNFLIASHGDLDVKISDNFVNVEAAANDAVLAIVLRDASSVEAKHQPSRCRFIKCRYSSGNAFVDEYTSTEAGNFVSSNNISFAGTSC